MGEARWWRSAHFKPEPQQLFCLLLFGVAVTFAGYIAAAYTAIIYGLWNPVSPPSGEPLLCCPRQLQDLKKRLDDNKHALQTCQARVSFLTGAQKNIEDARFYSDSPKMLKEEEQRIKELEEQRRLLQVTSVKQALLSPGLLVFLALMSMLAFDAGRLMLLHGKRALPKVEEESELSNWKRPYFAWVVIPFAATVLRELLTSVFVVTKSAFGYTSFCICAEAWLWQLLLQYGTHMFIAYPACIAWCLSRSTYLPDPKNLKEDASDGAWGVRDHILFLQTWSILAIVLLIPSTVLWVKFAGERAPE